MSKRTLLLADDSVTIQKVVNLTFADEGIEVVTVGDGDAAMEKISEIRPDVVLADVHMPGLSGYQICEIVRENPVTKDMPIVLLVGSFEPFDESEAARVGANAYLTKPFQSIRQLVSQVTDLMDLSEPEPEPVIPQVIAPDAPKDEHRQSGLESEAPARVPDTGDIDSLYHQSFSDMQVDEAETVTASPTYVDAGMDDEMIEASVVASPDEAEPVAYSESYQTEEVIATSEVEPEPSVGYAVSEAPPATAFEPADEGFSAAGSGAFDTLAEDQATAEDATPESTEFDELSKDATPSATEFDEFTKTEQIPDLISQVAANYHRAEETELLELPPIENGKTAEFTTPRSTSEAEGRQIVSLSPELMDVIVQKVVDKLSEKY